MEFLAYFAIAVLGFIFLIFFGVHLVFTLTKMMYKAAAVGAKVAAFWIILLLVLFVLTKLTN